MKSDTFSYHLNGQVNTTSGYNQLQHKNQITKITAASRTAPPQHRELPHRSIVNRPTAERPVFWPHPLQWLHLGTLRNTYGYCPIWHIRFITYEINNMTDMVMLYISFIVVPHRTLPPCEQQDFYRRYHNPPKELWIME